MTAIIHTAVLSLHPVFVVTCRIVPSLANYVWAPSLTFFVSSFIFGGFASKDFELPYDYLVVSVGATTNTFNTPGVKEHCIFLKQVQDAQKLRKVGREGESGRRFRGRL